MAKYKHKWIGLVLALAVAFSALLPFFATYNDTAPKSASLFGEKILICTGDGFALVNWADLLAGKAPVKQHKSFVCPMCYVADSPLAKVLFLAAGAIFLIARTAAGLSLFSLYDTRLKSFHRCAARPRAPPVSFIG